MEMPPSWSRRKALHVIGSASALALAGCQSAADGLGRTGTPRETSSEPPSGTTENTGHRYEACSQEVISYSEFPEAVQAELDAALDGRYEADRVYLQEAMNVEASYVSVDREFYEPVVTVEDDREALELHHIEPKALPNPRPVTVEHQRDGERTVTVEVVADDGTVLLDETQQVRPGDEVEFGRIARVGTHEFRITVEDGDEVEDEVTETESIRDSRLMVLVVLTPDDVLTTVAIADYFPCQYDE